MIQKDQDKGRANEISNKLIGAAIEIHRLLGPGLLESAYEECLCRELDIIGLSFERQVPLTLEYKGIRIDCAYRLDLFIENCVIVEIKSIEQLEPIHEAQLLTYLRLKQCWLGLLINFNVPFLRDGIKRMVSG